MKELSSWAEHLQEPLVLVGFIVMLFAGIIHAFLKSKTLRLSKRSFERLLKRTLAYIFILSLIVVIFGLALAFKKVCKMMWPAKRSQATYLRKGLI